MKRAIVIALIASTLLAAETAVRKFIPLPEPVNSPENDFAPSFTLDGNTMVFNSKRGNTLQDIYICHRTDGRWGVPRPIDAINSPFNDETPFITADGKVILFASDRDGSIEAPRDAQGRVRVSYDLYWAQFYDGAWTRPMRLPGYVNTAMHERAPSLGPDKRSLYYTAWPFGNPAASRIMRAEIAGNIFTNIKALPNPINTNHHDSCLTDAVALRDNVFRSAAMWGMYKGICDFYGVTPTWPLRSYELVSSDLPTLVKAGSSWTSHITLRNRGCVWNEAHQFRLGSVNSADPFGGAPRFTLESEIAPGQTVTFSIAQTAPAADGAYPTVWRMVQDERAAWFGSPVYSVVSVDAKPPTSPAPVNDGGPNQSSTTQIAASWAQSTDAKAGLNRYEYRVTDAAGTEIVPWTSTGLATSVTIDGTFAQGGRYFVWVKAVDNFDWETEPVSSPGVTIAPDAKSIGQAKSDADGAYENLQSKKVTGVLGDHIYVQEPDRSSGIRVDGVWTLAPGASVDVLGKIATANSERKIVEAQVTDRGGTPELPAALVISALHSGGAALNSYTPGVANAYGLHNIGLRVQVCGIVSAKTATGFRLNDGSLPDDGSGAAGILIESGSFHQPDEGAFAIVTGIPSFQPGSDIRRIVVAQDSDILP